MSLNNIIKISAAGSGKTWDICHDALEATSSTEKKVLITTYTNRGAESVRKEIKKQNYGVLSQKVIIKTWYDFLMSELIKPYQTALSGVEINEIKTFDFSHMFGNVNFAQNGTKSRYLTNKSLVRANEASNLAIFLNERSGGKAIRRLENIYEKIYFDEVQDLCGSDIDILRLLIDSQIDVICCGDSKQATYSTHNTNKNKKMTGSNVWIFFEILHKQNKVSIERNLNTRRFNAQICTFANQVFPIGDAISTIMNDVTEHDGVYIISKSDAYKYYNNFNPQILRYDSRTTVNMQRVVNFGACKGETFDRVLIYPNGPLKKYLLKQEMLKSPEKYYVAVTRPRYSIAFVLDELPERIPLFQRAVIQLSGDSIKCFKFQSGE